LEQLNESKQKRETLEVLVEEKRDALEARIKELERMAREYPQLEGIFLLQAQSLTSTLDYLDQMVEVMTVDDPVGGGGQSRPYTPVLVLLGGAVWSRCRRLPSVSPEATT